MKKMTYVTSMQSVLLGLLLSLFSSEAFGLEVVKKSMKRGVFLVNEKIEKGVKVCVKGKKGKKIICGKATRQRGENTVVKVSKKRKKRLKRVRKGFEAYIDDPKAAVAEGEAKPSEGKETPTPSSFMSIKALYMGGVMTPFTYNKISYDAPENNTPETLWKQHEATAQAIASFGLETELNTIGLAIGLRYRMLTPFEIKTDAVDPNNSAFDRATDQSKYIQTKITGTSVGFYADYLYNISMGPDTNVKVGAGLDIDMSTLSLLADQLSDENAEAVQMYTVKSDVSVASLRIPAHFQFNFGAIGMDLGIGLLIPLAEFGKKLEPQITDDSSSLIADDGAKLDIETSLGHGKSSFGVDILTGLHFSF